jgi:hypothetical protein
MLSLLKQFTSDIHASRRVRKDKPCLSYMAVLLNPDMQPHRSLVHCLACAPG